MLAQQATAVPAAGSVVCGTTGSGTSCIAYAVSLLLQAITGPFAAVPVQCMLLSLGLWGICSHNNKIKHAPAAGSPAC
jgi:hypothetical protein